MCVREREREREKERERERERESLYSDFKYGQCTRDLLNPTRDLLNPKRDLLRPKRDLLWLLLLHNVSFLLY